MRALFLSPNVPYPPENGGHHRNLGLIRAVARFASPVHVFAIGEPASPRAAAAREHLAGFGAELSVHAPTGPGRTEDDVADTQRLPDAAAHFRSPELAQALARRAATEGAYDVAHVEEVVMAPYAGGLACPVVIDRQKVDWSYHAGMARVEPRHADAHLREAARFLAWERRMAGKFDRVLVPGEGDRRLLEPFHGAGSVSLVPIAIPDDLQPPPAAARRVDHALLYGALDYGPNVAAHEWFFREVWPRLRVLAPMLGARVVGSGRPPLAAAPPPSDPAVKVVGFVPAIRPVLQADGALVVAVQVGGGVRTKILEALACGMPIVSTAAGVENLALVPGRDFLLAESAEEMAAALARLHRDPALVAALASQGPRRVEAYRWSRVESLVEAVYRDVVESAQRARPRPAPGAALEHPEVAALAAEIARGLAHATPARASPLRRRLARLGPVAAAERAARRALDSVLAPGAGAGAGRSARSLLLRLIRALHPGR